MLCRFITIKSICDELRSLRSLQRNGFDLHDCSTVSLKKNSAMEQRGVQNCWQAAAATPGRIGALKWRRGRKDEVHEWQEELRSLRCCLEYVFVTGVFVQREVNHFRRGHPVGLSGDISPELWLVCAVQLLHWVLLPGRQTLYHTSTWMSTPTRIIKGWWRGRVWIWKF